MAASTQVDIPDFDSILDKMGATPGVELADPIRMDDLRFAQGSLRKMVRSMDRVLEAAHAIAQAGEKSGWDRMAITSAIRMWHGSLTKVYGDFVTVRSRMYRVAKAYGLQVKSPQVKRRSRKNIYQMTESKLERELRGILRGLKPALRSLAGTGASLLKSIDYAVAGTSIGLTQANKLVDEFIRFRDGVGVKMIGKINGIVELLDARSRIARRSALQAHDETPWYMESRDPRHMNEEDLLAFSQKRDRQRSLGSYALTEDTSLRERLASRLHETAELADAKLDDSLIVAHKRAGASIARVLGAKFSPFGSGWSTSVPWTVAGKRMYVEVGGNWVPKPGHFYIYFKVIGPSFDRSDELTAILRKSMPALKSLGKYGKPAKPVIDNGIAAGGFYVSKDKVGKIIDTLPSIAAGFAKKLKGALGEEREIAASFTEALRRRRRPSLGQERLAAERRRSLGEYALDDRGTV